MIRSTSYWVYAGTYVLGVSYVVLIVVEYLLIFSASIQSVLETIDTCVHHF